MQARQQQQSVLLVEEGVEWYILIYCWILQQFSDRYNFTKYTNKKYFKFSGVKILGIYLIRLTFLKWLTLHVLKNDRKLTPFDIWNLNFFQFFPIFSVCEAVTILIIAKQTASSHAYLNWSVKKHTQISKTNIHKCLIFKLYNEKGAFSEYSR